MFHVKQRTYVRNWAFHVEQTPLTPHNVTGCYHAGVNLRRASLIGAVLLALPLLASCVGVTSPDGWAAPVVDGQDFYVSTNKGYLARITLGESDTATAAWTFPDNDIESDKDIEPEALYGAPVVDDENVYFTTFQTGVFALNKDDGRPIWPLPGETNEDRIDGDLAGGLVLADGVLYFGSTEGKLYAWRASDGVDAPGWEEPRSFGGGIWATPVVREGILYVATMRGELHALNLSDGSEAWDAPFEAEGAIPEVIDLQNGRLLVTSIDRHVYVLDAATGEQLSDYRAADWVWTTPGIDGDSVYFGDFGGTVYGLDISTVPSGQLWEPTELGDDRIKAGAAVIDGVVIIADRNPVVTFIDANTGQVLNSVPLDGAGTVRADVIDGGDGFAYILTTRGNLFRANPANRSVVEIQISGVKR
jgi:outer membrane protein assembly factor BamB